MQDCMFDRPIPKPTIHHFSIPIIRKVDMKEFTEMFHRLAFVMQCYQNYVYFSDFTGAYDFILSDDEADALGIPETFNGNLHISFLKPVDVSNWKEVVCEYMGDEAEALEYWTWNGKTVTACCANFGDLIQSMGFKYNSETIGNRQTMWIKFEAKENV